MMISVQPQKDVVLDDINLNNTRKCGRRINTRKGVKGGHLPDFQHIYIYTDVCEKNFNIENDWWENQRWAVIWWELGRDKSEI